MIKYILIAILSGIVSSISQVMLKKSAMMYHDAKIREYFNWYVIIGYILAFSCMMLMIYAYKGLPFKYGAILESLVYLYIMVLGKLVFEEEITFKRVIGNFLIVCGVIIFSI